MKPTNPLYIALLLIAVFVAAVVKLNQADTAHSEAVASLHETEAMAKRITALKETWGDGKKSAVSLERLLDSSLLRDAGAQVEKRSDRMVVTVKNIDRKALEYLMNKLLNGSYKIAKLKVKRLDERQASFYAEVAL